MNKHLTGIKRRAIKVRATLSNARGVPRMVVNKSAKHIYAQLVDDVKHKTLVTISDQKIADTKTKITKMGKAKLVGTKIAEEAKKLKITSVIFDRSGYRYHGRIQAVADAAREGGLKF